jgi:peptidoglycan/LPS O-acetylase OafA/YrhL
MSVPGAFARVKFTVPYLVSSFMLVPMKRPWSDEVFPVLIPGWTLTYEIYFCGLFALALPGMRLKTFVAATWIFFAACAAVGPVSSSFFTISDTKEYRFLFRAVPSFRSCWEILNATSVFCKALGHFSRSKNAAGRLAEIAHLTACTSTIRGMH